MQRELSAARLTEGLLYIGFTKTYFHEVSAHPKFLNPSGSTGLPPPFTQGRLGSVQTPRLWREPRERKPLTCSLLIVWTNHIVGYLSTSTEVYVLHKPIIYTQYKVLCATFFQESGSFPFPPMQVLHSKFTFFREKRLIKRAACGILM